MNFPFRSPQADTKAATKTGAGVLVIHDGVLEAFIQALPALRAIRAAHRGERVVLLTRGPAAALAADSPYVNDVESLPEPNDARALAELAQGIKRSRFAMVYDLAGTDETERLYGQVRPAPPWSGPVRGASHRFPTAEIAEHLGDLHPTDAYLAQVEATGVPSPVNRAPDVTWAAQSRRSAPSLQPGYFGLTDPFVFLIPAVAATDDPSRWPEARFAGLAQRLTAAGACVAVVAEEADRPAARAVVQACPAVKDLSTRADLTQLAALTIHAGAALGHQDSGLTHLFAAGGTPTISLGRWHGDARQSAPRGSRVLTLVGANEEPAAISMQEAASVIAMFAGVGATSPASRRSA